MIDVIVVGSGPSGVHAAWPLVMAGLRVVLVDAGTRDTVYTPAIPPRDFTTIRRGERDQHRWFLGDDFEGIPLGPVRVGAQLTPPRQHIGRGRPDLLPLHSPDFQAMHSLALGGLGAAWGASAPPWNDDDIAGWPIRRADLQPHYDAVAARIGVCGDAHDDLARDCGPLEGLLPPAPLDSNGEDLLRRYARQRDWHRRHGLVAGAARLAVATVEHRGRGPLALRDMEFWADTDRAVYRPVYTLEELQAHPNFSYRPGLVVDRFVARAPNRIDIECRRLTDGGAGETLAARRLVLAAGTIGTARIVLASAPAAAVRLPLVANPYTYYPCLNWPSLGRPVRDRRHSLTQVLMFHRPPGHPTVQAQVYSYRSLLTFKILKEAPLAVGDALPLFQLVQSRFLVVGVHHEARRHAGCFVELRPGADGRPTLCVEADEPAGLRAARLERERQLLRHLRRLGALPLRRIDPGLGASIHYAGCLPMAATGDAMTTTPEGTLRLAPEVVIADGAVFPHLPAKGLTLTLMANANRVGQLLAQRLMAGG
jgi:choline dehydrogenase-like flavoprotein